MTSAKVTRIPTAIKPDENYIDDPKIVKIAMLSLILTDKNTDFEIKRLIKHEKPSYLYIQRNDKSSGKTSF